MERREFRSSRNGLRRSRSNPAHPLTASREALWGKDYDEDDGDDKPLQRILKENKERRAPKNEAVELVGKEWRIEGWQGKETAPM